MSKKNKTAESVQEDLMQIIHERGVTAYEVTVRRWPIVATLVGLGIGFVSVAAGLVATGVEYATNSDAIIAIVGLIAFAVATGLMSVLALLSLSIRAATAYLFGEALATYLADRTASVSVRAKKSAKDS